MKRSIFAVIIFIILIISFFPLNHLYSKAFGFESIDKKNNNLVVVSVLDLPSMEVTQIYDRDTQIVCYITVSKSRYKGPYMTSMECIPIKELTGVGRKFLRQYE